MADFTDLLLNGILLGCFAVLCISFLRAQSAQKELEEWLKEKKKERENENNS
jgi:hypothetical protein